MDNEIVQQITALFTERFASWGEVALQHIPNFFVSVVILVLFYFLAKVVSYALSKAFHRTMESTQVVKLMLSIVRVFIIGVGCFIALEFLGLKGTVTSLLAGAGIVGLALGFAFQDLSENFIAGVAMGIRKPFTVDDVIESEGVYGRVTGLNFRNTLVETFAGQMKIVPNKHLFRNVLTNYSYTGERRLDIPVGISYADDIEKASEVIVKSINEIDGVIRKADTSACADGFGDSSINLTVRYWIKFPSEETDYLSMLHKGVVSIKRALDENDIVIPFPIRTLDFAAKGATSLESSLMPLKRPSEGDNSEL